MDLRPLVEAVDLELETMEAEVVEEVTAGRAVRLV